MRNVAVAENNWRMRMTQNSEVGGQGEIGKMSRSKSGKAWVN
jgi:hypothetical protein